MMTESCEFENVKIGNWQGRLPSQICTDRDIFNEIFSLETWDKILMPDQKDRILKMLPLEVLSTPGAADQTIEDLLAKTLTRFDSNPLENLFNQLEVGQLDPDVVVTKAAIRKEWRKESLRKRKKYHTKLLEEIVVSREKHLKAFESPSNSFLLSCNTKMDNGPQPNKLEKIDNHFSELDGVYVNDINSSSKNSISNVMDDNEINNHIMKRVNKRVKEELSTINRQTGCLSSSEDESPVIKKPSRAKASKTSKSSTTSKQRTTKLQTISKASKSSVVSSPLGSSSPSSSSGKPLNVKIVPNPPSPISQTIVKHPTPSPTTGQSLSTLSSIPISSVSASSRTSTKEQTAAKMAKFPKILPAPATNQVLSSSLPNSSTIATQNHLPVKSSHVQIQNSLNSPSNSPLSNPVKSSPILASQLQAPAMSMAAYSAHNSISKLPNSVRKFSSMLNFNPHSKLSDKSSEDDLESSSDEFEFESLNPSMVFSTNNFSPIPKKSVTKTKGSSNSARQISKIAPLKPKAGIVTPLFTSASAKAMTPTVATVVTSKIQTVSPNPNPKTLPPYQQQVSTKVSGVNTITTKSSMSVGKIIPNAVASPITNTVSSIPTNLLPPIMSASVTPQNVMPLTVNMPNSSTPLQPTTKILFTTNPGTMCNDNSSSFSSTAGNGIHTSLNSIPSVPVTTNQLSPIPSGASLSSISLNLLSAAELHQNNALHQNIHDQHRTDHGHHNSNVIVDTDDLNLNNLSLGLEMGINMNLGSLDGDVDCMDDVDGDNSKLVMENMDKMDDLSVLDGNPFDSIPNLSDELDGLDLDMVDGLCDFDGLLSEEKQYTSFFSLIREVLCSTRDHRMTLICLEKTIRKWASSPSAALNPWFMKVNDWNEALITALNFLAGNYQDIHPEEFVPYIEYKYKTKYYQWIGAGRDGDNNLTPLCTLWMDNLDRLPPLKKLEGENEDPDEDDDEDNDSDGPNEDAKKKNKRPVTPPPPRCVTDWAVRPSTQEEKENFQIQERSRFDNPHKAFTYRMHGYESVVGPVKGVYSSQSGMTNKARGHSLLVDDRPPYVTILALVRDAVARLPNGEGTRSEICEMLRDSAFLAAEASNVTLNSVVSGALDRLHYERDPCVRYDSHKKSWIYLHRDRTQEQFERLHHNRSYTKSTKSRNNTSRKSRKTAAKSPAQVSSSPNDSSGGISASTSAVGTATSRSSPATGISNPSATSTPISAGRNQSVSAVSMSGTLVSTQTLPKDNSSQSNALSISAGNHLGGGTASVQDAAATLAPTIRFTIPGSSTTTTLGGPFTNSNNSCSGEQQQHLILQTNHHNPSSGGVSITTAQNQVPIQIQSQAPLQVQNLNSAGIPSSSTVTINNSGGSNLLTVTSAASTTTSSSFAPGQFVFGPQALLRLAGSLRLPEGVRFTQLRVPSGVPGAVGASPLRLPQHRILLTRGSLPGSTQGVILQTVTSTGQTVLLSTTPGSLGNLQGASTQLTPISLQSSPSSVETMTNNIQHAQAAQNMNIINANSQNVNVVTTASLNSLSGSTVTVSQGMNSTQLTGLDSGTNVGGTATISLPASLLANSNAIGNHQPLLNHGNATSQSLMTSTGTPMQTLTVAQQTQNMVSQVQAQLQQQNTGGPQTAQLTSPIIIRSNQGDFVIPGHISLGRGMQGIKVIPMPTGGGKQTVIARIVAPTTNAPNPVNPTSNTQS